MLIRKRKDKYSHLARINASVALECTSDGCSLEEQKDTSATCVCQRQNKRSPLNGKGSTVEPLLCERAFAVGALQNIVGAREKGGSNSSLVSPLGRSDTAAEPTHPSPSMVL